MKLVLAALHSTPKHFFGDVAFLQKVQHSSVMVFSLKEASFWSFCDHGCCCCVGVLWFPWCLLGDLFKLSHSLPSGCVSLYVVIWHISSYNRHSNVIVKNVKQWLCMYDLLTLDRRGKEIIYLFYVWHKTSIYSFSQHQFQAGNSISVY